MSSPARLSSLQIFISSIPEHRHHRRSGFNTPSRVQKPSTPLDASPAQFDFEECEGNDSFRSSCCYPLSDCSVSRFGDGFSMFGEFGCRGFSSWVVAPGTSSARRGIKPEWAVPRNYSDHICFDDAVFINASAVRGGGRCVCGSGFVGDGFVEGIGCFQSKLMGFRRSPPPFLSLTNSTFHKQIGKGVSFASGGAGILDSTGSNYNVVSMGVQIQQFEMVHNNLTAQMGENATNVILSKSVFLFSVGSNDIFENNTLKDKFIEDLTSKFKDQLSTVPTWSKEIWHNSVPPIGCCPAFRKNNATGGCINELNEIAFKLHGATHKLLNDLSSKSEGMKYSLGNSFEMVYNVFHNPQRYAFKELTKGMLRKRETQRGISMLAQCILLLQSP